VTIRTKQYSKNAVINAWEKETICKGDAARHKKMDATEYLRVINSVSLGRY